MRGYVLLAAMVALSFSGCDDTVQAQDWRQEAVIDAAVVTLDVSSAPAEPLPVLPDEPEPTPAKPQQSDDVACESGACQPAVVATTTVTYQTRTYTSYRRGLLGRRLFLFRRCRH